MFVNDPEIDAVIAQYHAILERYYQSLVDRSAFVVLLSDQRRWDVIALPGNIHLFVIDYKYNVLFSVVKAIILCEDLGPAIAEQARWALVGWAAFVAGDYRRSVACLGVAYGLVDRPIGADENEHPWPDAEQAYDRLLQIRVLADQQHDEAWLFLITHEAAHVIVDEGHPASILGRKYADSVLSGMLNADLRQIADLRDALERKHYVWRGNATTPEAMAQEITALEEFVAALREPEQLKREIACDYHALVANLVLVLGSNPFDAGSQRLDWKKLKTAVRALRFVIFWSTIMSQIVWLKGTMERLRDGAPARSINRAMVEQRIRLNVVRISARDALRDIRTRRFSKASRAKKTADPFLRSLMSEDLELVNQRFAGPCIILLDALRDEALVDRLFNATLRSATHMFDDEMTSESDIAGLASAMVAGLPF